MDKIMCIIDLFRKGNQVANPEAWKDNTNIGLMVGALIMSLLTAVKIFFKIDLDMDLATANSIGAGIGCLVAFIVNNVSSKRAGILPAKEAEHPIAVPDEPVPRSFNDLQFQSPEQHPKAIPEVPVRDTGTEGLSNGGLPKVDEAALKAALAALRRDRKRA